MSERADSIAEAVIECFGRLPAKRKPVVRDNGLHEWVPLSGIVAEVEGKFTCVAMATGMKCLPASKITSANGLALHDWHAEIFAIRTFNRYLLDSCSDLGGQSIVKRNPKYASNGDGSIRPFIIGPGVRLHMYCSEAPCGDASMELTMGEQQDSTSWDIPDNEESSMPGRAYFSKLGIVRRKPARNDAPPTLSKSCSDKIALRQCTSLLSSVTDVVIDPGNAYIDTLVMPTSRYSAVACDRAFSESGRLRELAGREWADGYSFTPFAIETTSVEFEYSKQVVGARAAKISASNLAAAWSASGLEESTIGGIIQGRRANDLKCASGASRRELWAAARRIADQLGWPDQQGSLFCNDYETFKCCPKLAGRRQVKREVWASALRGWVRNEGDSSFSLD